MTPRLSRWHGGWAGRLPDYDPAAGDALVLRTPRPDTALAWPTHGMPRPLLQLRAVKAALFSFGETGRDLLAAPGQGQPGTPSPCRCQ